MRGLIYGIGFGNGEGLPPTPDTLAQVLAQGNITGGNDIVITIGDSIKSPTGNSYLNIDDTTTTLISNSVGFTINGGGFTINEFADSFTMPNYSGRLANESPDISSNGANIFFNRPTIHGSTASPITSNLVSSETSAVHSVNQRIYHQMASFVEPATWNLKSGFYYPNAVNIIDAYYVSAGVIEYTITNDYFASVATGTEISFAFPQVYGTYTTPEDGNVTNSLTGAKIGVIQKIYHEDSSAPTFPAGWVLIGSGAYVINEINIIYAEWSEGTRVEYWITQEA